MTRRSALITGGSAGIGLAVASALAEDGWDLTIAARDQAKLDDAVAALSTGKNTVHAVSANLAEDHPKPWSGNTWTCTAAWTCW